ncbi:MAG: murein biosynthesis integral membrane protein MurJ [Zetaproteobacteria bacterium]|nr:MAG: murein biosynthesis integral membrane protein MurJ [Zetaproteobacteria bacterium]
MTRKQNKSNQDGSSRKQLLAAAGRVGGWTLLSRILGFARDIFLARILGAGVLADAFFVAFKLPNFFRRMFAEGTLTVALVPVLNDERQRGEKAAHAYLDALGTLLLLVLTTTTALGMLGMPWLLIVFAPGFMDEPDRWQLSLSLARWMFPYLLLISLTAMAWGVLNTYQRFSLAAASPALLNLAIIFAAVVLAPRFDNPAYGLAIGVLLGGMLQLGVQWPALRAIGWQPRLSFNFRQPAIAQTLRLFGPALLAVAAVQINILVGTILATLLEPGAVSYLYYSDRIVQLPLGIFGIAMSTALLPTLSAHLSRGDAPQARQDLKTGLVWLGWITLPAVAGLWLLARPIIQTLFEHGAFDHHSTVATAHALQAYALGLLAFCWVKLLATACYAEKDAKAPMRFAAVSVAVNILLAIILMRFFSYIGLALATSLAAIVNATLLWRHLAKRHGPLLDLTASLRLAKAVLGSLLMMTVLDGLSALWPFPMHGQWLQVFWLAVSVVSGAIAFFAFAMLSGELRSLFGHRQDRG